MSRGGIRPDSLALKPSLELQQAGSPISQKISYGGSYDLCIWNVLIWKQGVLIIMIKGMSSAFQLWYFVSVWHLVIFRADQSKKPPCTYFTLFVQISQSNVWGYFFDRCMYCTDSHFSIEHLNIFRRVVLSQLSGVEVEGGPLFWPHTLLTTPYFFQHSITKVLHIFTMKSSEP